MHQTTVYLLCTSPMPVSSLELPRSGRKSPVFPGPAHLMPYLPAISVHYLSTSNPFHWQSASILPLYSLFTDISIYSLRPYQSTMELHQHQYSQTSLLSPSNLDSHMNLLYNPFLPPQVQDQCAKQFSRVFTYSKVLCPRVQLAVNPDLGLDQLGCGLKFPLV